MTFRVGSFQRTFINIASCKIITPSPRKVATDARPLTGKGLCCPWVAKSLLSKSNVGSMAVFRAAFAALKTAIALAYHNFICEPPSVMSEEHGRMEDNTLPFESYF